MGSTTNKVLAAKTRKAHKMDVLAFNAGENMRVALEYRYDEIKPYNDRQRDPVTMRMLRQHGINMRTRDHITGYGHDTRSYAQKCEDALIERQRRVAMAKANLHV